MACICAGYCPVHDGELAGLPNAWLAVLPATTHISVLFRVDWLEAMIGEFLNAA